jgi:hypothetical protein
MLDLSDLPLLLLTLHVQHICCCYTSSAAIPRQFAAITRQFAAIPRQFAAIPRQFAAIPRGVRTSLPLALTLRGASLSTHATCPLPPRGWDRTVNGTSTPNHPPPQRLPPSRGRWHYQAGRGHAVATPPSPPRLPLHRSRWQAEKGRGQAAAVHHSTCRLRSLALQRCAFLGQSCSRRGERHQLVPAFASYPFAERGFLPLV